MKPIQFDLPLPPRCLHPNAKSHWGTKARSAKKARTDSALVAKLHAPKKPWRKASVQFTFHLRTARGRVYLNDADNLLAACKAVVDGFADAGIVENDRQFSFLPVRQQPADAQGPRLSVLIFKEDDR